MEIRLLHGAAIAPYIDDLARLRLSVFREFPYLYDGTPQYEADYLSTYARSGRSLAVLAIDQGQVVGASTGLPLVDETPEFQQPFLAQGRDPASVYYFGESVLLPDYRGQGLGHRFFDEREAHARALGRFRWTAFCAVDRDPADPRRPEGHRGNEAFWTKRGYVRQPGMTVRLSWPEPGHPSPTEKPLTFWLRPLP